MLLDDRVNEILAMARDRGIDAEWIHKELLAQELIYDTFSDSVLDTLVVQGTPRVATADTLQADAISSVGVLAIIPITDEADLLAGDNGIAVQSIAILNIPLAPTFFGFGRNARAWSNARGAKFEVDFEESWWAGRFPTGKLAVDLRVVVVPTKPDGLHPKAVGKLGATVGQFDERLRKWLTGLHADDGNIVPITGVVWVDEQLSDFGDGVRADELHLPPVVLDITLCDEFRVIEVGQASCTIYYAMRCGENQVFLDGRSTTKRRLVFVQEGNVRTVCVLWGLFSSDDTAGER